MSSPPHVFLPQGMFMPQGMMGMYGMGEDQVVPQDRDNFPDHGEEIELSEVPEGATVNRYKYCPISVSFTFLVLTV